jgi:hypothetical protein
MKASNAAKPYPNGPAAHRATGSTEATCPYCGSKLKSTTALSRIEQVERTRTMQVEQALADKFAREQAQAEARKQAEIQAARREAVKSAELQIRALKAGLEQRVQAARDGAEKRLADAIATERAKHFEDRMKLNAQITEIQRKLEERKTAGELGDALEIDIYDELKGAFPSDRIERVPKGTSGADIIHRIVQNGTTTCGTIIFDCKNHRRWQSSFIRKLRLDQSDHQAEFAVLATNVFPTGTNHLHIIDGVIVASPARVIALAHLLRRQIVQMHLMRLGNADRDTKKDEIYEFIRSDRCNQLLDRIGSLSEGLSDLHTREETSHRNVWSKRSELIRAIKSAHVEFLSEVDRIITTHSDVSE